MTGWEDKVSGVHEYVLEAVEARGLTTADVGIIAGEVKVVPIEEVNEEKLGMNARFKEAFLLETA